MAAALLALCLLSACGAPDVGPEPGLIAPEITALDLEGNAARLEEYRGRVVVLDFWTGGCGPCLVDLAQMEGLYRQYRDDGLTVLALNQGEPVETVIDTIERLLPVTYPIAIDQRGESAKRYGVRAVPTTFLLDRRGVVREKILGEISRGRLEVMLTDLLGVEPSIRFAESRPTATPASADQAKHHATAGPPAPNPSDQSR